MWCSTYKGNQKLNDAYKNKKADEEIYMFFSVNGEGQYSGVACMDSEVKY